MVVRVRPTTGGGSWFLRALVFAVLAGHAVVGLWLLPPDQIYVHAAEVTELATYPVLMAAAALLYVYYRLAPDAGAAWLATAAVFWTAQGSRSPPCASSWNSGCPSGRSGSCSCRFWWEGSWSACCSSSARCTGRRPPRGGALSRRRHHRRPPARAGTGRSVDVVGAAGAVPRRVDARPVRRHGRLASPQRPTSGGGDLAARAGRRPPRDGPAAASPSPLRTCAAWSRRPSTSAARPCSP